MDRLENEYFELVSIVDEAKELMQTATNELQKLPGELFSISTKMLEGVNHFDETNKKYAHLADEVRRLKVKLPEFRSKWDEISDILDALDFKLFLAEAHIFAHNINAVRNKKKEQYERKWHGRYKS